MPRNVAIRPNYQLVPDRSVCHQMFLISHVILRNGLGNASYETQRIRDETTAAYRVLKKRPLNIVGCVVEIPFTYGNIFEVGVVGPCVLSGHTIAVHSLRIPAAFVDGYLIEFTPAYEKLLIASSSEVVSKTLEPRSDLPDLSESIIDHLQKFAQEHLHQYMDSDRVHPRFHVEINLSYPSAVRVMSPQEALLNYIEITETRPEPVEKVPPHEMPEEELMEIGGVEGSDIDLFDETLTINAELMDLPMESVASTYIANRYRPTMSLPFKGRGSLNIILVPMEESTSDDDDAASTSDDDAAVIV